MRRVLLVGGVLLVVVVAAIVVIVLRALPDDDPAPVEITYVALGDSYTAGPGMDPMDLGDGCRRSDRNYPTLVAATLDVGVLDVSCTGARTAHLTEAQETGVAAVAPQLDALESLDGDAGVPELVTIEIGANDEDISTAVLPLCGSIGADDPTGSPCTDADRGLERPLAQRIETVQERLTEAFAEVRQQAPDATILAIGYPQVFPARGTCPDRLTHAEGDYPWARALNEALDDAVRRAAQAAGIGFVDVWSASEGHDVCSADPWINGAANAPGEAQAYHPFAAYMTAVADLVVEAARS